MVAGRGELNFLPWKVAGSISRLAHYFRSYAVKFHLLLALFSLSLAIRADDKPVIVPPAAPAKWVELKADPGIISISMPKITKWVLIDDKNATLKEEAEGVTLFAANAGEYRLMAFEIADGKIAKEHRILVVVGVPKPPEPVIPPAPVDPLFGKLQLAYTADSGAAKATELGILVALYSGALDLLEANPPATVGELVARLRQAAGTLGVRGLESVRKAIADELKAVFPADTMLNDAAKASAVKLITRIRDSLAKVK
jgi:hypothetical protein